jgi:homopolymeric O-antigen transport system permease protein
VDATAPGPQHSLMLRSTAVMRPVYDSAQRQQPFLEELVEAWRYRDLVVQLVQRDIRTRYKRSILGVAWTMLNPLLMMTVLTLVFSHLFRFEVRDYPVYLLSAQIVWTFIAQTTTAAMSQLLWGGALLTKIYVPRTVFALAAVGTGLVNLVLSIVPLLLIAVAIGAPLSPSLLLLPVPIIFAACFALGLGLLLSTIAVAFPDVVEMYQVLLTVWYFVTPIMYPRSIIPEEYRWLLNLNPIYHIVEAFRAPIYAASSAGPNTLVAAGLVSIVALSVGWIAFSSRADEIPYQL